MWPADWRAGRGRGSKVKHRAGGPGVPGNATRRPPYIPVSSHADYLPPHLTCTPAPAHHRQSLMPPSRCCFPGSSLTSANDQRLPLASCCSGAARGIADLVYSPGSSTPSRANFKQSSGKGQGKCTLAGLRGHAMFGQERQPPAHSRPSSRLGLSQSPYWPCPH